MDPSLQVMIFMGLVLKIPVALACWLIYWAVKAEPEVAEAPEQGGEDPFRRFRREPKRPRGPRRGPHAPDSQRLPCPDEGGTRVTRRPTTARPLTASSRPRRHD